jgi:hypothetical protein
METKAKKIALILSDGDARGAFQCRAERYVREVKGYHWDIITTGRKLRYVPCHIIDPDYDLGDTLDCSQPTVQASLKAGVRRAGEVLGEVRRGGER